MPTKVIRAIAGGVLLLGAVLAMTGTARAEFGFVPGSAEAGAFAADATGAVIGPETQAGATPYEASTTFELNSTTTTRMIGGVMKEVTLPDGNVRDIQVDLPAGMVGNPEAVPTCPRAALMGGATDLTPCPASTQVGIVQLSFGLSSGGSVGDSLNLHQYPVYNIEPRQGDVANFAFVVFAFGPTHIVASLRDDDYRVRTSLSDLSVVTPVIRTKLTLWGVPASPLHNSVRGAYCLTGLDPCSGGGEISSAAPKAFLRTPTSCDGSRPVTEMRATSWQNPAAWMSTTAESPAVEGCERLSFVPSMSVIPDSRQPDAPTGLDVSMGFPQTDDPDVLAPPDLKKAVVRFPMGMSINPAAAGGLVACSDSQLRLAGGGPLVCPAASKIGSARASSPLLDESLSGGVYIRSQASMDPESGKMFRLALVLESQERGISVRLPGSIRADAETGRLVAVFDNNPQLPVSSIDLSFKSGPRAPLVTPSRCGKHEIRSTLTSWAGQSVDLVSRFQIACTGASGLFTPGFSAGTVDPVAGASSPFLLRAHKPDGQSDLTDLELGLPEGLLATLRGNVGRRVGTARVAAGPGASPFWLSGPVVLEGPYRDAPFSLRVTVPAVAGPFNLGDVVVRQRIFVDPETTRVRVVSDPLPQVVRGVPVRLQDLAVDVDRAGFMLNPTDCTETAVNGVLGSATGLSAAVASRFQVGDCATLDFAPRISARILNRGRRSTLRSFNPRMRFVVRGRAGEANIGRAAVTLPRSVILDQSHIRTTCTRAQFADRECPNGSIYGYAKAWSPVLNRPLTGPVYLASNGGARKLPDLVADLNGEVRIVLRGWIDSAKGGRIRNIFPNVPDAPVSRFALTMRGGKRGILVNSKDLCRAGHRMFANLRGQNGKKSVTRPRIGLRFKGCKKVKRIAARRKVSRQVDRGASRRG